MSILLVLSSERFWAIFDQLAHHYSLVAIDINCPPEVIAICQSGDRYQIKVAEYANQPHQITLSNVTISTKKL